jgi:hypothetical protein
VGVTARSCRLPNRNHDQRPRFAPHLTAPHRAARTITLAPLPSLSPRRQVDILLVTHFHIDHIACLPYLTEKTNFKGKVFMTHPTKAVMRMLLLDYIRLDKNNSDGDDESSLYTEVSQSASERVSHMPNSAPNSAPHLAPKHLRLSPTTNRPPTDHRPTTC